MLHQWKPRLGGRYFLAREASISTSAKRVGRCTGRFAPSVCIKHVSLRSQRITRIHCCAWVAGVGGACGFRISDFGFRIDGDLLPKLDSVPRSNALICLSQSREGRQALQDKYSWLQKEGELTKWVPGVFIPPWPDGRPELSYRAPPRSGWVWLIRRRMRTAHLARPRPLGVYVEMQGKK